MPANAGSASRWGPLFGMRASAWADTWEGPGGWGTLPYQHALERADVRPGIRVLDCGCGAGRFARMAADRGASVAGIDASAELIAIASERTKEGDFRVGDIEALPWDDDSFDLVTGFSAFQFADDKVQALREAGRVTRGTVVVVDSDSGGGIGRQLGVQTRIPVVARRRAEELDGEWHVCALGAGQARGGAWSRSSHGSRGQRDRVPDHVRGHRHRRTRIHGRRTNSACNPPLR